MAAHSGSPIKAILFAFSANLAIALTKFGAALFTGSGSMMAEAIHSAADTANQMLLFVGLKGSARPATPEHPMGFGKLSYFWSFVVALMLFSMGGMFSIYEGIHKLDGSGELKQAWVGLVVLVIAITLEGASLAGCLREVNLMRGDRPILAWLRHTRSAEIIVVLGEDMAAIVGLVLAFCFLLTAWLTGDAAFDAWGSICIGVVLILVAAFIAVRVQSLLVGKSAEPELRQLIDEAIGEDDHVLEVLNTITMHFGAKVMLAAKIRMHEDMTLGRAVTFINELEARIKARFPEIAWCFIEPDNRA